MCQNCTKSSRDCRYVERAVFRTFDSSVLLNGKLKNSVDTREPFDDNQTWLSIPRRRKKIHRKHPIHQINDSFLTLGLVTFINIEDPYDYDSPSLPECESENLDQSVAHNLDDETAQTPHAGKGETSDEDRDNLTHFSIALNGDESLAIPRSNDDSHDNILALRLLRHFKEGPGQW